MILLKSRVNSKASICFSNQIFHFTCCFTLKRVTSLRGPSPRHCACEQYSFFRKQLVRSRAVGSTVFNSTGPKFEAPPSCSIDERVTARPTIANTRYCTREIDKTCIRVFKEVIIQGSISLEC